MKAISGREPARVLERRGWELIRIRGSHHLYGRGDERIVIPVHGNQTHKAGLERDLMKQAGISDEDLYASRARLERRID